MKKPTSKMLERLRDAQEDTFNDTCTLNRVSWSSGTYSDAEHKIVTGTSMACGFWMPGGIFNSEFQSRITEDVLLMNYDVLMRVPVGTVVDHDDYFDNLTKSGVTISGSFQVVSQPIVFSSVMHLKLKRTTL